MVSIIHEIISDAEFEYKPGESRMIIPVRSIKHHPDKVRASALDSCELKHAYSKMNVDGIYEVEEGNRSLQHLFKMGEYAAYLIQESLMQKAMNTPHMSFEPEIELDSDELGVAGRADGLLSLDKKTWIVEIKNTEGQQKRSIGPARYSYALQTIAYMIMANIDYGVIVTTSKWQVNTYEVVKQPTVGFMSAPKHWKYLVYDSRGELVDEIWNNVDDLSYTAIQQKVGDRKFWMNKVADWVVNSNYSDEPVPPPERPIEDPFNHPQGWQCFWMFDKGRHVRPPLRAARANINCKFADKCYGLTKQDTIALIKDDNQDWQIVSDEDVALFESNEDSLANIAEDKNE